MSSDSHSRQDDSIRANPHIVADDYWLRADSLLVYPSRRIFEIVVQRSHRDALSQVYVIADAHRSDDRTVNADARMIANGHVTYCIIDAAVRLNDTLSSQLEISVGWGVHPYTPIDFRPAPPMLIQRCQHPYIPPRPCIPLVHDKIIQKPLQSRISL